MKSRSLWMVMAVGIAVVICGSIWPLSPVQLVAIAMVYLLFVVVLYFSDRLERIESRLEAIAEGQAAHSPTTR